MRHWICILILVFASTSIGNAQRHMVCPYESLSVDSDFDLPDSTDWYSVEGCSKLEYSFSFVFTPAVGNTIIYYRIDSTSVYEMVDSEDYGVAQQVEIRDYGWVYGGRNRMYIDIDDSSSRGHFNYMLFQAWYSGR